MSFAGILLSLAFLGLSLKTAKEHFNFFYSLEKEEIYRKFMECYDTYYGKIRDRLYNISRYDEFNLWTGFVSKKVLERHLEYYTLLENPNEENNEALIALEKK